MKSAPFKHRLKTSASNTYLKNESIPSLPHERDEKSDGQSVKPEKIMRQAYQDLQRGLVDTDMHGERGVEEVVKNGVKVSFKNQGKSSSCCNGLEDFDAFALASADA